MENKDNKKTNKHILVKVLLIITFIISICLFINNLFFNKESINLIIIVNSSLILLFVLFYFIDSITNIRKNMLMTGISSFILILLLLFNIIINTNINTIKIIKTVPDLTTMSLNEVIDWSTKNNISLDQDYEYSDMINEYNIISQNIKKGSSLKGINSIKIAVSEGPNPSKELIVENMVSWDSEKVIKYVYDNHLSNVDIEFVSSTEKKDTVIEQNKSGNMRRDEKIELKFSYGEELGFSEVKLVDLTNKSKFEAMFYLKQNQIKYEFKEGYSDKVKKGYVYKQNIKAGKTVKVNDTNVVVYISKGPKVKVVDVSKMKLDELINWIIQNKLKITFEYKYDDKVKKNEVISTSCKKGDILSQGDTIKVVISKGKLKMLEFKSIDEFTLWADKYKVKYRIDHEFSDTVKAGDVISYSHKAGDTIKNDDTIVIKVSDGEEIKVPNLKGLTKSKAIDELKKVGLNYNFVTKSSDSVDEGKVISQSLSAGSKVSKGATVTVTISSGKSKTQKRESSNNTSSSNNNSSSRNNSNNNSGSSNNTPTTPTCTTKTYTIGRDLNNIFSNPAGYDSVYSQLSSYFSSNYPDVKISIVGVDETGSTSGSYVGGIGPGSKITSCNSSPYTIQIAK